MAAAASMSWARRPAVQAKTRAGYAFHAPASTPTACATSARGIGKMAASAQPAPSWTAKYPSGPTPAQSASARRRATCTSASAGPDTLTTS
eukprot:3656131-Alexandrium_andersonii.AAC.2